MTLVSQRSRRFADITDLELARMAVAAQRERNRIIAKLDETGADSSEELDAIDTQLFRLDDELCARDLGWPHQE